MAGFFGLETGFFELASLVVFVCSGAYKYVKVDITFSFKRFFHLQTFFAAELEAFLTVFGLVVLTAAFLAGFAVFAVAVLLAVFFTFTVFGPASDFESLTGPLWDSAWSVTRRVRGLV